MMFTLEIMLFRINTLNRVEKSFRLPNIEKDMICVEQIVLHLNKAF